MDERLAGRGHESDQQAAIMQRLEADHQQLERRQDTISQQLEYMKQSLQLIASHLGCEMPARQSAKMRSVQCLCRQRRSGSCREPHWRQKVEAGRRMRSVMLT